MGPKKLIIKVKYKSELKVFTCYQHEMEKAISSHFKIDMNDVTMFAIDRGERYEVSSCDIRDLMKIEIVPNRKGQKNIQDYINLDPSTKIVESITSKLQQNIALAGQERKHLIDLLKTHSTSISGKRKLDHTNVDRPVVQNKKCQVNMAVHNKESFCQTDPLNVLPEIETVVSSEEEDKQKLKRLWTRNDVPHEQIDLLMQKTFNKRRHYILIEFPPVAAVREQYPALFCVEQVKNELERIFYSGKCTEFLDNMNAYAKYILRYKGSEVDDILEMIEKAHSRANTTKQKEYAEVVGSIFVLARHLDENFGLIHLADHPHSSGDMFPHINASPCSLQQIFFDDIFFHIKVEGQDLCTSSNFPEAFLCLMATFFIFNIHYPESCRRTLTVIEKVYLNSYATKELDDKTEQWIKYLTMSERRY